MQGKSSKGKGYRGEVEFRDLLRKHGFYATREKGSLDDVTHSVPGIHFEVKRREKLDIPAHMKQAQAQAGDRIPVVAFRGNRQPWRVILDAEDFLALISSRETDAADLSLLGLAVTLNAEGATAAAPSVLPLSARHDSTQGDTYVKSARVESLEEAPTEEAHGRDYGDECSCGRCQTAPSKPL